MNYIQHILGRYCTGYIRDFLYIGPRNSHTYYHDTDSRLFSVPIWCGMILVTSSHINIHRCSGDDSRLKEEGSCWTRWFRLPIATR